MMQLKPKTPNIPEPVEGEHFYIDKLQSHIVAISVTVRGMRERDSEADICFRAIEGLRNGALDGEPEIMCTTNIRDIELDFETDKPFDREAWQRAELRKLGLNENGDPLRAGEKDRPLCETTLADFSPERYSRRWISTYAAMWLRQCWRAVKEAI